MFFALCEACEWKDFFAQVVSASILLSRQDGDAIAAPFLTSNSNRSFPLRKF